MAQDQMLGEGWNLTENEGWNNEAHLRVSKSLVEDGTNQQFR